MSIAGPGRVPPGPLLRLGWLTSTGCFKSVISWLYCCSGGKKGTLCANQAARTLTGAVSDSLATHQPPRGVMYTLQRPLFLPLTEGLGVGRVGLTQLSQEDELHVPKSSGLS